MNKKTLLRIIVLLVLGGIVGAVASIGLIKLNGFGYISVVSNVGDFFVGNILSIQIVLITFLYLPSVFLYLKGKKVYDQMASMTDDEIDNFDGSNELSLDYALLINSVFAISNLMLYGIGFNGNRSDDILISLVFMVSVIAASLLEIIAIRYVQKVENHLKGDPTSFKFNKVFLESCDEAEKLKIYKSGYYAFQFTQKSTLALLILSILIRITLDTSSLPVLIIGGMILIQITMYNYYALKNK